MGIVSLFMCGLISSLLTSWLYNRKTVQGEMDVEWDEQKQVWNAAIHIPNNTNYHKYDKLVLNITKK